MKILLVLAIVAVGAFAASSFVNAAPPPKAPTILSAVVNTDGTLARGSGAVSSSQTGTDGYYDVTFNRDVSGCTYTASGGTATSNGILDDAVIFTVSPGYSTSSSVAVLEYDAILGYDSYSSGFHLIVAC